MVCSDEEDFSYDGSYFEEVIELSEEEEDDDGETSNDDKEVHGSTPQHKDVPTGSSQKQPPILPDQSALSTVKVAEEPKDESESYEEEEDDEYIIEEFVEENYEVPLAGSEEEAEDETSFDDNSTAYDPDDDAPIITAELRHRQSNVSDMEIGKTSDHSMDVDNAFELTLPFIPKTKQMSAVTLDWDFYQDSMGSWGALGSDEGSDDGNDDRGDGGRAIIYMDERMLEMTEGGPANDGPKRGVARNKSGGMLGRRPSLQRAHSGGVQTRGALSRNSSGNLRGAIDRSHSGGLVRPMPGLLATSGMPRRKSHGHIILSPLDTLAEEVTTKEEGTTHNQLLPPAPPTESDNSRGSSDEFGDESQESSKRKDANSTLQDEKDAEEKSTEESHSTDLPTNEQILAKQQNDGKMQNGNTGNIQSTAFNDGELPIDDSTNATNTIHINSRENTMEHGIRPLAENISNPAITNTVDIVRPSKDSTTISNPDEENSPPDIAVTGPLEKENQESHKKDEDDDTTITNTDQRAKNTTFSNQLRPSSVPTKFQSPATKAETQRPVTPSPSRPAFPSPASSTKDSKMRKSRSIDQLRRSNHLNLPGVSNHSQSQLTLPRRASKRNVHNANSPGMNSTGSDIGSPKTGKVSRFEQLLKRSTAIKAVR